MSFSLDVINAIRNGASDTYKSLIPIATLTNLTAIGTSLKDYDLDYNEFIPQLINKITQTIIISKSFKNPWGSLKSGKGRGDTEEIFVKHLNAIHEYDPKRTDVYDTNVAEVEVRYHRRNRRDVYETSITRAMLQNAFHNVNGVEMLVMAMIDAMYTGAEFAEFELMKKTIGEYDGYTTQYVKEINDTTTQESCRHLVKTIKKIGADMKYMSDKYNKAKVVTHSNLNEMVLFVNEDILAEIGVEVLAWAFNAKELGFPVTVIPTNDFGELENTYAILCDKSFFKIKNNLYETTQQFNPKTLITNIFLHIWQTYSLSEFSQAVRFAVEKKVP